MEIRTVRCCRGQRKFAGSPIGDSHREPGLKGFPYCGRLTWNYLPKLVSRQWNPDGPGKNEGGKSLREECSGRHKILSPDARVRPSCQSVAPHLGKRLGCKGAYLIIHNLTL